MSMRRVEHFLEAHEADFTRLNHSPAYTAPEVAESAHFHGDHLLKAVVIMIDGMNAAMVVLAAHQQLSFEKLRDALGAHSLELASESEIARHFTDCETGAIPPFGSLYDIPIYIGVDFEPEETVAFTSGSHSELLCMTWGDYLQLEQPEYMEGVTTVPLTPPKMTVRRGRMRI